MKHTADCACHDWPVAGDCNCGAALDAANAEIERLRAALKPFAVASDSYDGEAPAHVVASKGGAIVSVYDLRIAKAVLG